MMWTILGMWMVVVRDNGGKVVYREEIESGDRVMEVASRYINKGYEIEIRKVAGGDGEHLTSFVEGSRNVVSSISAGAGVQVDNTDPSNPVISLPPCSDNQLLMRSGGSWTCVDKSALAGGNYTNVSMMSSPSSDIMYWFQAFEYCANLTEGDYDDWRVPTGQEFVYYCVTHPSDENCTDDHYWISTYEGAEVNEIYWAGGRYYIAQNNNNSDKRRKVRCVR